MINRGLDRLGVTLRQKSLSVFFFTMSVLKLKQKDTKYCHFLMFPLFRSGFLQDFLHSIFSSSQCLMDYLCM